MSMNLEKDNLNYLDHLKNTGLDSCSEPSLIAAPEDQPFDWMPKFVQAHLLGK